MFHVALTPAVSPTNAFSAKAPTLIGALGELFKMLDTLEFETWIVGRVLEAAKEAVDNLENDEPAKGTWTDMGSEDDAFSIDIFCADDARYVKVGDDELLAPHGAVAYGVGQYNTQEWIYDESEVGDYDWVYRPQPVRAVGIADLRS